MAASSSTAPVQSELKMTLHNKEVYSGWGINGVTTIVRGGPIGTTWVFSWPVTNGPPGGADANIVGYLQGTGVQVAYFAWHYSLGLLFGHKSRFNGSTLQIQGTSQINGEWSIVGGTGELTMAKGMVKRTEISYMGNTRISELNIHVFYTPMKPTSVCTTSGDEDIIPSDTKKDPPLVIQGPITRAHARQLNLKRRTGVQDCRHYCRKDRTVTLLRNRSKRKAKPKFTQKPF